MPTFRFVNTQTNEEFDYFISNHEKKIFLENNPNVRQIPTGFTIVSAVGSVDSKTDNTWKEVLSKVAEKHPNSSVGQRYGKKTIKQIKTEQIAQKHLKSPK